MATRIGVQEAESPRIIVDCTHTFQTGAYTGIQRVVRSLVEALLAAPQARARIVPARVENGAFVPLEVRGGRVAFPSASSAREDEAAATGSPAARRAALLRRWGHAANAAIGSRRLREWLEAGPNADGLARRLAALSLRRPAPDPAALSVAAGDIVVALDSSWVYDIRTALEAARRAGATRIGVLYDVLPVSHPQWFTEGTRRYFGGWLDMLLARVDEVLAISATTCRELANVKRRAGAAAVPCTVFPLGAELAASQSGPVREPLRAALSAPRAPAFLTVGTLEPRKNVAYAMDIFDALRAAGLDLQWHIVGAPGWLAGETIARITSHPDYGGRLRWWADLRDEELEWAYRNVDALVSLSRAEGFGLPLVEGRLHGLPVFASDIPVFREVLGAEGRYLPLDSPRLAAAVLEDFLTRPELRRAARAPSAIARSWSDAATRFLDAVLRADRAARARAAA